MENFYAKHPQTNIFALNKILPQFLQNILSSSLAPALVSVLSLLAVANLQLPKLHALTEADLTQADYQQAEALEKVKLDLMGKIPSFGFDNLMADWAMLRFIQYYGDGDARKETGYSLAPQFLEAIVENDPRFIKAYLILSPASSINAGRPDRTVAAMEKGLQELSPDVPSAEFVWLYKAIDELLFLGNIPAAKHSYTMAADWAKEAGNKGIEQSARDTVNYLSTNPDSKQAQVGAWFMVFANTRDKETRLLAKSKIEALGGQLIITPDGRAFAVPPKS